MRKQLGAVLEEEEEPLEKFDLTTFVERLKGRLETL